MQNINFKGATFPALGALTEIRSDPVCYRVLFFCSNNYNNPKYAQMCACF